jgi:hypothetical protein
VTDARTSARDRALEAWEPLRRTCLVEGERGSLRVLEGPGGDLATVWPLSQVLAAAIDLSLLTGDLTEVEGIVRGLRDYERGEGYVPLPGRRRRYYDDNAWIGLCFAQLHLQTGDERWLARAQRVFGFVRDGQDADGGVRWREGRSTKNTCATAPAAQLALRLFMAGPAADLPVFADRAIRWLDRHLRLGNGLFGDHIGPFGRIDRTVWSYNQGAVAGDFALSYRISGDDGSDDVALEDALRTAFDSMNHFDGKRLWAHPPVFNAIWMRNLLALDALEPIPDVRGRLEAYLDRLWKQARDPATGLFTAGDIGSYDRTPTIDHAGLVQLFGLRAWPRERLLDVC